MATKKRGNNIFGIASADRRYVAAKKRADKMAEHASKLYKTAVKKAAAKVKAGKKTKVPPGYKLVKVSKKSR